MGRRQEKRKSARKTRLMQASSQFSGRQSSKIISARISPQEEIDQLIQAYGFLGHFSEAEDREDPTLPANDEEWSETGNSADTSESAESAQSTDASSPGIVVPPLDLNSDTLPDVLKLLATGEMEIKGLMPWSSNYTFLVYLSDGTLEALAIYKPRQGESPLWDFPRGTLCQREVAAYHLSEALGWGLVPPTVMRDEGPYGLGSVQLYVDIDPQVHYFTFKGQANLQPQLERLVILDLLMNNADRKSGHCLLDDANHIWAIDHGVCFNVEPKLRTVIWDYAGKPIPAEILADLAKLAKILEEDVCETRELTTLLAAEELQVLKQRLGQLCQQGVFSLPGPGRHYPWPPV